MARRLRVAILCLLLPLSAVAQSDFVVRDMRVEGLQRISEGTVFNYLPINIGDRVDKIRIQEAIRALYGQGLFDDIEIRRDGETLIVHLANGEFKRFSTLPRSSQMSQTATSAMPMTSTASTPTTTTNR